MKMWFASLVLQITSIWNKHVEQAVHKSCVPQFTTFSIGQTSGGALVESSKSGSKVDSPMRPLGSSQFQYDACPAGYLAVARPFSLLQSLIVELEPPYT